MLVQTNVFVWAFFVGDKMSRRKKYYYYGFDFEGVLIFLIFFLVITIISKYYIYLIVIGSIVLVYFLIRMIINSDIFGKFKDVKLYYNGDTTLKRLEKLEKLEKNNEIEYKINCIKKGINGENKILYTLMHSDIPMYILHDLNLEVDGFKSQIDFIVVTKKIIYIIESKDLNGNLDIEEDGTFTRRIGKYKKGIKNPITQNMEHELTLNKISKLEKLHTKYKSIVVLSNDNAYINYKKGSESKFNNIVRNDQLYNYLKNSSHNLNIVYTEKDIKNICDKILKYNNKDA